jgi:hypothetical protein
MAGGTPEVERPPRPARVVSLDFLRGLVLTMVLVDHVDDLFPDHDFFTRWTLKGLGFSDAAEAFVFLAGLTFGWVYTPRLHRDGFRSCQIRVLARALKIYAAMLATAATVAGLAWSVSKSPLAFRLPLTVTTPVMFVEALRDTATLTEPVWGISILVVYVSVLPFLPAVLLLATRSTAAAVATSGVIYAGTQLIPEMNLGDAGFNPLAWQVLMVSGMVIGSAAVSGTAPLRISGLCVAVACAVVLVGLAASHGVLAPDLEWVRQTVLHSAAFSKTNLGIGRIVHFAAVATIAAAVLRRWPAMLMSRWARLFVWSGRHSLTLFCVGVVLSYLSAMGSAFLPSHSGTLLFLAADAAAIQFALAWALERRRAGRNDVFQRR